MPDGEVSLDDAADTFTLLIFVSAVCRQLQSTTNVLTFMKDEASHF
jgi:hypothetical protein